jgi:hypothetical protein
MLPACANAGPAATASSSEAIASREVAAQGPHRAGYQPHDLACLMQRLLSPGASSWRTSSTGTGWSAPPAGLLPMAIRLKPRCPCNYHDQVARVLLRLVDDDFRDGSLVTRASAIAMDAGFGRMPGFGQHFQPVLPQALSISRRTDVIRPASRNRRRRRKTARIPLLANSSFAQPALGRCASCPGNQIRQHEPPLWSIARAAGLRCGLPPLSAAADAPA